MARFIPKILESAQFCGPVIFFLWRARKEVIDNSMARFLTLHRGEMGIIKTGIFKFLGYSMTTGGK